MEPIQDYIKLISPYLAKADDPIRTCDLTDDLKKYITDRPLDSMLVGMAVSQLNVKASNGSEPSPSGYPRKFRRFHVKVVPAGEGNVAYDEKKLEKRRIKKEKTIVKNRKAKAEEKFKDSIKGAWCKFRGFRYIPKSHY